MMSQSDQGHSLIIQIKLDNSGNALRYEVDKVKLVEGKIPGSSDPAAQIHFDCFHCNAKYFILPEIMVKLEMVPNANTRADVKKEPELNLPESGSLDEVLSEDDGDFLQGVGQEMPLELPVKNEEIQESEEPEVKENLIQIQPLDLQPFVRLVQIDDEMKGQSQQIFKPQKKKTKPKKTRFYTCDICKSSVKYRKSLIRHMKIHIGIRFSCSECPKSFSRKSPLSRHKKRFHQGELRICEVCGWSQTCNKDEYLSHLRRRHPEFRIKGRRQNAQNFNGVDFPCIYCEPQATFVSFEELKEHLGDTHDRNFACTLCPKAFGDRQNLKRHIESVHEKKTFKCPKCDKVFIRETSMQKHLQSHNL